MKSNIDIINDCDSFPYDSTANANFWRYHLEDDDPNTAVGYVPAWVVEKMPWNHDYWSVDQHTKTITSLASRHPERSHSAIVRDTLATAKEAETFEVLKGWRNELYQFQGHSGSNIQTGILIERAGSCLFGVNTYGVHMTAFVQSSDGLKIWVPRRSYQKQTYPGVLDNSVAGGLSFSETPIDCMVKEAIEEASLPEDFVRQNVIACGTVSYISMRDGRAGGETGLFQPECQYVYDLELSESLSPKPNDGEVADFYLWSVDRVRAELANGSFKPNCALVLVDFLIRHGFITAENEPHLIEIVSRLHRKLPFPTRGSAS